MLQTLTVCAIFFCVTLTKIDAFRWYNQKHDTVIRFIVKICLLFFDERGATNSMKNGNFKKWIRSEKTEKLLVNVFLLGAFIGGIATILALMS